MAHNPHGCRCSRSWRRSDRAPLRVELFEAGHPSPSTTAIAGTWDFKWPQGHIIRVAFQDAPIPRLNEIIDHVKRLATQWTLDSNGKPHTSVQLEFLSKRFPAPRAPETQGSISPAECPARSYDVLISLAPLPVFEPETPGDPRVSIEAATSQLGSYALRSDFGVPTTYLGPPAGYGRPGELRDAQLARYFGSRLFQFVVTHEFGHILGLAHEHQNPKLRLQWRNNDEIREIMRSVWDLPSGHSLLSDEYINTEIKLPWPGNPLFSDWREATDSVPHKDSIMAHALFRRFLRDSGEEKVATAERGGGKPERPAPDDIERISPTPEDLAELKRIYRYRPLGKVSVAESSPSAAQAHAEAPTAVGDGKPTAPARPRAP